MGYTCTNKPKEESLDVFLERRLIDPTCYKIIDTALIPGMEEGSKEWYAAVRYTPDPTKAPEQCTWPVSFVFCMTVLVEPNPQKGYNIGFRADSEFEGSLLRNCPKKILKRLTALPSDSSYAPEWRKECWQRVQRNEAIHDGVKVSFEHPLAFKEGDAGYTDFIYRKEGRMEWFELPDGSRRRCEIPKWKQRSFTIETQLNPIQIPEAEQELSLF